MDALVPIRKRRRNSHHIELESEKDSHLGLSISVLLHFIGLVLFSKRYQLSLYQVSSLVTAICFAHFLILFFQILLSCNQLHHIRIRRRRSSISSRLFVPYDIEIDKNQPVTSISAIIGLRGSNAEKIASALCYVSIGDIFVAVLVNIIESDKHLLSNSLMLTAMFGVWLVLTWPLEYALKSDKWHYIGVSVYVHRLEHY